MVKTMSEKRKGRILFRLIKGFLYGNVIGLIFGVAIYLLAAAVDAVCAAVANATGLPVSPTLFLLLVYGVSVTAGTAAEYSRWLEEQE